MPRLRTPSLKIRQNLEFTVPTPPSTSTRSGSTTRTSTPKATPVATKTPSTAKRGRGRPKGSTNTVKKGPGRPRTAKKGKPWDDDLDEVHFDYESCSSSSSSSDEDDEEFVLKAVDPPDFIAEEEEIAEHHNDDHVKIEPEGDELEGAILCPWLELDQEQIPPLNLPESSQDIPLYMEYVMDMIEMYEILRSYSRTLRLSPFVFEDFCAAMSSVENSCLLSEIHIALLKACWRSDDEEQVHYSANDTNNAVNIAFYSLDSMTYAEVLRMYLEGDRARGRVPEEILTAINTPNYPFVGIDVRASVITYLCYRFLDTSEYKKIVNNVGKFANEEACRVCSKGGGELMACDNCDLSFHPICLDMTEKPTEEWLCSLCSLNQTKGVTSCIPLDQVQNRQPLRMTPIGRDRHGRIYWFVVRRIIVQDEAENMLYYYSTAPQLYELVSSLDPTFYEYSLCKTLCERLSDILEQMAVSLEMTTERREIISTELQSKNRPLPPTPYLHVDNLHRMHDILKEIREDESIKKEPDIKEEEDEMSYQPLPERMLPLLGITHGSLVNNFWSGHYEEDAVLNFDPSTILKDVTQLFCMGQYKWDDIFRKYKNLYASHDHGEPLAMKKKAADRKKYLSTRFSLVEEGEDAFRWSMAKGKDMYGPERQHAKYLEWTIGKLVKKIPEEMMHRRWSEEAAEKWKQDLTKAENFQQLAEMLVRAECCMRRTLFLPQFWNSLGLTRLTRTTVDDREQISKDIQKRKKEEKDLASPDFSEDGMIRVKYTRIPSRSCPQGLWRQKDELYRLGGRGELGGWIWVSKTLVRDIRSSPESPPLGVTTEFLSPSALKKPAVKKAIRLESLVQKLSSWRETEAYTTQRQQITKCYSPNCRTGFPKRLVCDDGHYVFQSCYSLSCRNYQESEVKYGPASSVATARDITRIPLVKQGIVGEGDMAWPLNKPTPFMSRGTEKKSILVIPDIILRKLARQGGRVPIYVPNFSLSAKSNYSLWNYPCYRPCFDLCWKWLTTNARSLQAVCLQLKILWQCIKWSELVPAEDDADDGRVIVHHPDRDELRIVIAHKEFPPQGTYERYKLRVESVMLDDDVDDDDYSDRTERKRAGRNNRPKRSAALRSQQKKNPTREEWIDGVELKASEIRMYWQQIAYRKKERRSKKDDVILSKNIVTLKDLQRPRVTYSSLQPSSSNVSYGSPAVNTAARLKYYGMEPGTSSYSQSPSALAMRQKRIITQRRNNEFAYEDSELDYDHESPSEPALKKARVIMHSSGAYTPKVQYTTVNTQMSTDIPGRRMATGYEYNGGMIRGGGRIQPVGDGMRRVMGTSAPNIPQVAAEETVTTTSATSRAAAGGDDDMPPVITRYDSTPYASQPSTNAQARPAVSRQVVYAQRPAGQNLGTTNGKVLMIRRHDGTTQYLRPVPKEEGAPTTMRTVTIGGQQSSSGDASGATTVPLRRVVAAVGNRAPGTVVRTVAAPTRIVRIGPGGQQVLSTIPAGSRIVTRVPVNGTGTTPIVASAGAQGQTFRRTVQPGNDDAYNTEFVGEQSVRRAPVPQGRIAQGFSYSRPMQRVISRGGTTMNMGQRLVQVRTTSQVQQEPNNDVGFGSPTDLNANP